MDALEQAAEQALTANQLVLLLSVLAMLEEVPDIHEAKRRLMAVINELGGQASESHI